MLNRRETLGMTAALGLLHGMPALAAMPNRTRENSTRICGASTGGKR
jgi:hypothetical protein